MGHPYVHGYSDREALRLQDQAETLGHLLHSDTRFEPGSKVLEAGCGTGAQTVFLARNNPDSLITAIDLSETSLQAARARILRKGIRNVSFRRADIHHSPFGEESFDHIFLCFVLEHLRDPLVALTRLKPLLKQGGTLTAVEGDHGSAFFHPDSRPARKAIQCLIEIQAECGGNSLIGRELYPLFKKAGFRNPTVSPRMVYADSSRPAMVEGFTKNTFTAMVEGVRDQVLTRKMISEDEWQRGIGDLYATAGPDGVFCYTFLKAWAFR